MISPKIAESINTSVLCWLATVSPKGEPNVSPKEAFLLGPEEQILIAHVASPQSISNILTCPQVCLSFIDIFTQRGYKIGGTAEVVNPANPKFPEYSASLSQMLGDDHEILAVMVITPQTVDEVIAPSYTIHPQTTEENMIRQSFETYRIADYQRRIEQDRGND